MQVGAGIAAVVAQQPRPGCDRGHEEVEVAVVVVVGDRCGAAGVGPLEVWPQGSRDIDKAATGVVAEHLVGLPVGLARIHFRNAVDDVAVGCEEVEVAVVVVVEKLGAKAEGSIRGIGQPEALGGNGELALAIVAVEGVGLKGEVGDEKVGVAIAVVVAKIDAHTGVGVSVLVVTRTGNQADLGEGAVLVGVEEVHGAVVGYVDVGVAVAVVVGQRDAQPLALEGNAGRRGDVGKGVAVVAVEEVAGGVVRARLAVRPHGPLLADGRVVEGVAHVVGDEEVEITVAVIVEESGAGAPARIG